MTTANVAYSSPSVRQPHQLLLSAGGAILRTGVLMYLPRHHQYHHFSHNKPWTKHANLVSNSIPLSGCFYRINTPHDQYPRIPPDRSSFHRYLRCRNRRTVSMISTSAVRWYPGFGPCTDLSHSQPPCTFQELPEFIPAPSQTYSWPPYPAQTYVSHLTDTAYISFIYIAP